LGWDWEEEENKRNPLHAQLDVHVGLLFSRFGDGNLIYSRIELWKLLHPHRTPGALVDPSIKCGDPITISAQFCVLECLLECNPTS